MRRIPKAAAEPTAWYREPRSEVTVSREGLFPDPRLLHGLPVATIMALTPFAMHALPNIWKLVNDWRTG